MVFSIRDDTYLTTITTAVTTAVTIGIGCVRDDWPSLNYPANANFRIEIKIWSHRNAWAPAGTFGQYRINRKIELTGVELTEVYCTVKSCHPEHTEAGKSQNRNPSEICTCTLCHLTPEKSDPLALLFNLHKEPIVASKHQLCVCFNFRRVLILF